VWQVPAEVARGIQRRSATELLLDPRAVASIYARGADLLAGTRLDPVREGDQVIGVELGSIAPDPLLDRLGVESGDVLRALDRERIASLDGVAAALADARTRRALVARLARGGAEFDLELVERALATE
jgi:type II secretory pathway component PulC